MSYQRQYEWSRLTNVAVGYTTVCAVLIGVVLGFGLVESNAAFAQQRPVVQAGTHGNTGPNTQPDRRAYGSGSSVERLPEWARSQPSRKRHSSSEAPTESFRTNDPGRPGVPVDGGLVWLVVAGVGYAVYRLQRPRPSSPLPV